MMISVLTNSAPQHAGCINQSNHQKYGVLPWRIGRQNDLRLLLITDRNQQHWGVPTGKPSEGQTPLLSVALDAFEEAGIIGEINPQPLTGFGVSRPGDDEAGLIHRITLFSMQVRGTLLHWKEYGQRQRGWFSASEAAERLEGTELAGFLRKLVAAPHFLTGKA